MGTKCLLGPVLSDLEDVGLSGTKVVIATAFYTNQPLQKLQIGAEHLTMLVRLDLHSIEEWARGAIAPDALLQFANRIRDAGTSVNLFVSPAAHAKVYLGQHAFLVGSANLTSRGFSGTGRELLWRDTSPIARKRMATTLKRYQQGMSPLSLIDLEQYIARNIKAARRMAKRIRTPKTNEGRVPSIKNGDRPKRLGQYSQFLNWLCQQSNNNAAQEIFARGNGKGNLSGHIYRNFYGLRQFLLSDPRLMQRFRAEDSNTYKLSADQTAEQQMADFVADGATNEEDFSLEIWKTYLPRECGGRAGAHGGTIGNLNRMLPLVAKYLSREMKKN